MLFEWYYIYRNSNMEFSKLCTRFSVTTAIEISMNLKAITFSMFVKKKTKSLSSSNIRGLKIEPFADKYLYRCDRETDLVHFLLPYNVIPQAKFHPKDHLEKSYHLGGPATERDLRPERLGWSFLLLFSLLLPSLHPPPHHSPLLISGLLGIVVAGAIY